MIKFNFLIHKETGTVIKYGDWKEAAKEDSYIIIKGLEVFTNPKNIVKAKEMLFNDDFEIIYDFEFTVEELKVICLGLDSYLDEYSGTGLHHKEFKVIEEINDKIKTQINGK